MATYYIDPVSGNDASAGTSWATAWKTFISGATSARLGTSVSQTIKVAKTPDPITVGTGAVTWTSELTNTITIPGLDVLVLDNCESGWTTAGPTLTYPTTIYRQGTASAQFVAGSQSGALGYKNFSSQIDASSYSRITFWVSFSAATDFRTTSNLRIQLCSGSNGNSVANTLDFPLMYYPSNYWVPVTIDYAGPLGSTLNSILLSTQGTFTGTVRIDNICVTGAASSATSLTLSDVIAKSDGKDEYYPITSLGGTGVTINPTTAGTLLSPTPAFANYYWCRTGTETITTVKRAGLNVAIGTVTGVASSTGVYAQVQDTAQLTGIYHTYIGGWNTSTDTRDGETWFDGSNGYGYGSSWASGQYTGRMENFGFVRFNLGTSMAGRLGLFNSGANLSYVANDGAPLVFSYGGAPYVSNTIMAPVVDWGIKWGLSVGSAGGYAMIGFPTTNFYSVVGVYGRNAVVTVGGLKQYGTASNHYIMGLNNAMNTTVTVTNDIITSNNATVFSGCLGQNSVINLNNVICLNTTATTIFNNCSYNQNDNIPCIINIAGKVQNTTNAANTSTFRLAQNVTGQFIFNGITANSELAQNSAAQSNGKDLFDSSSSTQQLWINLKNFKFTNSTPTFMGGGGIVVGRIAVNNYNQAAGDNRVYFGSNINNTGNYWRTQSAVNYAGTTAWEFLATSGSAIHNPIQVGDVAVAAGSLVTITIRGRRTASTMFGSLIATPNSINGVTNQSVSITTNNTWELLTMTFTPTENGVVTLWLDTWSSAAGSVYFDDLQVSQA